MYQVVKVSHQVVAIEAHRSEYDNTEWLFNCIVADTESQAIAFFRAIKEEKEEELETMTGKIGIKGLVMVKRLLNNFIENLPHGDSVCLIAGDEKREHAYIRHFSKIPGWVEKDGILTFKKGDKS